MALKSMQIPIFLCGKRSQRYGQCCSAAISYFGCNNMVGDLYLNSRLSQNKINCPQPKEISSMKSPLIKKYPITWLYFFFFFFSGFFQLFLFISGHSGFSGLRASLIYCTLPLIPILLWPHKAKTITAIIGLFMLAGAWASLGYWIVYGQEFSQDAIFIIFESNMAESYEFFASYLRMWHVLVFLAFSIIPVFIWRSIQPITIYSTHYYKCTTALCACRLLSIDLCLARYQHGVNQGRGVQ
tara:strand:- start:104686 stop:105408 length:723 start_codon:yes stop_codon:yes gene_type:complete